jgi:hypothetical protein
MAKMYSETGRSIDVDPSQFVAMEAAGYSRKKPEDFEKAAADAAEAKAAEELQAAEDAKAVKVKTKKNDPNADSGVETGGA